MNTQIRRLFVVVLTMFAALGLIVTNNQVIQAPSLNADGRNQRTILHAAEIRFVKEDRGFFALPAFLCPGSPLRPDHGLLLCGFLSIDWDGSSG